MKLESNSVSNPPPDQEAIRAKSFYPPGTFVDFKKEEIEQSIPERFEKIVRKWPDRIAVRTADQVLIDPELNAMANGIACAILAKGSTSGQPVGIILDKEIEQVAAMLGILKGDKFYVLLDTAFPLSISVPISHDCHDAGCDHGASGKAVWGENGIIVNPSKDA